MTRPPFEVADIIRAHVLSRVFRGKFVAGLRELHSAGKLAFHRNLEAFAAPAAFASMLRTLFRADWVVYAKRPWRSRARPALSRSHTHRVAISNHRLVALEDGEVAFRWRDLAHRTRRWPTRLALDEFLRRFFLHAPPRGFVLIGTSDRWPTAGARPCCRYASRSVGNS